MNIGFASIQVMRYFVILLGLAFAGFLIAPLTIPQGFALCMINEDWQDAPCWGLRCVGNEPACTDPNWWKERWAPYYDHKGKDWMESKKQELLSAIESKSLTNWLALTVNGTNTNVHDYYYYMGEVPNRYGVKVNQAFAGWYPPLKQLSIGMASDDLFCREDLSLIFKKNGSPACVTYPTGEKLVKRGWATCDDSVSHHRGHPCGPRSSGVVSFDSYKIEPEPEPGPIPESDSLQRQKQQRAKLHTQEIIISDTRGHENKINAIKEYRDGFESGYFLEQFIIPNKQNYEKGELIKFVYGEWGYQPKENTSPKVDVYFRSYDDYDQIEKINEWQKPKDQDVFAISHDSDGYLMMDLWGMPPATGTHETCTIPGEYRVAASNPDDESKMEWGYFTCQKGKLVGESQPWMELPE